MKKLLQHRYALRQNLFTVICLCLCFYFSYHALHGERGVLRLWSLNNSIATMSLEHDVLRLDRLAVEAKVKMMRPGSVNKDLLEEQVRKVLGYKKPSEILFFGN